MRTEVLEPRTLLSAPSPVEAYAWTIINQLRSDPGLFADNLERAYHGTSEPVFGYASTDPLWADFRDEISRSHNPHHFDEALALMRAQPSLGPLAWQGDLGDISQAHNDWMKNNCYAHSVPNSASPPACVAFLPGFNQSGPITDGNVLDSSKLGPGYDGSWGENIGFYAGRPAWRSFQTFGDTLAYTQRVAFLNTVGFMTEVNSPSLGHLRSLLSRDGNSPPSGRIGANANISRKDAIGLDFDYFSDNAARVETSWLATHTLANASSNSAFLVGEVFEDRDGDGLFDADEGIQYTYEIGTVGGAVGSGTRTLDEQGVFSERVAPGTTYEVTIRSTRTGQVIGRRNVSVGDGNAFFRFRVSESFLLASTTQDPSVAEDRYDSASNNESAAAAVPILAASKSYTIPFVDDVLSIDSSTDTDWFRFDVTEPVDFNIDIGFDHAAGNLDIELLRLDEQAGTPVSVAQSSTVSDDERISGRLETGRYYVRVFGVAGAENFYSIAATTTPIANSSVLTRTAAGRWVSGHYDGTRLVASQFGSHTWSTSVTWSHDVTGDFNGDGLVDVAAQSSGGTWWVQLAGSAQTTAWGNWGDPTGFREVQVGDADGDGIDDLIAIRQNGQWYIGYSDGNRFDRQFRGQWSPNAGWQQFRVADFNGDGGDDIAGLSSNAVWWVGNFSGPTMTTQAWARWNRNQDWTNVQVGDFDGNGIVDLAGQTQTGTWFVAASTSTRFISTGWGKWSRPDVWTSIHTGDVNGDGRVDLVGQSRTGHWVVALAQVDGSFRNETWARWQAGGWRDFAVLDLNHDGRDDILARSEGGAWWVGFSIAGLFDSVWLGRWSDGLVAIGPFVGKVDHSG